MFSHYVTRKISPICKTSTFLKTSVFSTLRATLTSVPLSLSYSDGSMLSSPTSNLMKYLETFAGSETTEVVHETIIDAIFFFASSCEFTKHV